MAKRRNMQMVRGWTNPTTSPRASLMIDVVPDTTRAGHYVTDLKFGMPVAANATIDLNSIKNIPGVYASNVTQPGTSNAYLNIWVRNSSFSNLLAAIRIVDVGLATGMAALNPMDALNRAIARGVRSTFQGEPDYELNEAWELFTMDQSSSGPSGYLNVNTLLCTAVAEVLNALTWATIPDRDFSAQPPTGDGGGSTSPPTGGGSSTGGSTNPPMGSTGGVDSSSGSTPPTSGGGTPPPPPGYTEAPHQWPCEGEVPPNAPVEIPYPGGVVVSYPDGTIKRVPCDGEPELIREPNPCGPQTIKDPCSPITHNLPKQPLSYTFPQGLRVEGPVTVTAYSDEVKIEVPCDTPRGNILLRNDPKAAYDSKDYPKNQGRGYRNYAGHVPRGPSDRSGNGTAYFIRGDGSVAKYDNYPRGFEQGQKAQLIVNPRGGDMNQADLLIATTLENESTMLVNNSNMEMAVRITNLTTGNSRILVIGPGAKRIVHHRYSPTAKVEVLG